VDGRGGGRHEVGYGINAVEHRELVLEAKIASGGEHALDERVRRDDHRDLDWLVGPASGS
jgi:hypothetical protein